MTTRRVEEEVDADGRRRVTAYEDATEHDLDTTDREVAGEEEVVETQAPAFSLARGWLRTLGAFVAVAFAVIETALLFRFGFKLADANPANGFVDFIYDVTKGLVDPFDNIVAAESAGNGILEWGTLIAVIVYAVVAFLIMMFIWAASSAPSPSGDRAITTRSRHRTRELRG